jgi:hypothetical protein
MQSKPHFITEPHDSASLDFRQDCMAWELYTKKSSSERDQFIKERKQLQTQEFTHRLRRCQAWWMLAYLNRHLIDENLRETPEPEREALRQTLNTMRAEIKVHRQIELKTYMGSKANA